jgi:eukaryotic-like serine/threonine-protein kinase
LRFLREGQAASRIRHPNVADVYDVGIEGNHPYLVMELLEGEVLAQVIKREGPLSVQRTADLLLPVIAAVATAHDQAIVHRDLKPENIFLAAERKATTPKVLDFGISKVDRDDTPSLTDTGVFLGTPYYMSPEQAHATERIDIRSDQYSLGVILYECSTGRRPIEEPSMYALLRRIVHGDFPSPRQVNPALSSAFENVILRAMALNPAQRFPTTRALALALLDFASSGVRASHADELASTLQSRRAVRGPSAADEASALGTTQSDSVLQPDVPDGSKPWWPWVGAGALLAASGIVGLVASRAPIPTTGQLLPASKVGVTDVAAAPSAADLPHEPAAGALSRKALVSEPADASVWVGGIEIGKTPLTVDVPADTPLGVELRFPGYDSDKREISRSGPDEVRVRLTPHRTFPKPAPLSQIPPSPDRPQLAPR